MKNYDFEQKMYNKFGWENSEENIDILSLMTL